MKPNLTRRGFLGFTLGGSLAAPAIAQRLFPPVPRWRPTFQAPLDTIAERMHYYLDRRADFAVFENGTCAVVDKGLSNQALTNAAQDILSAIYNFHPDFNPLRMDDGNILVTYNYPAYNIIITEFARKNWAEIEARHLDGLTTSEVIMTPTGQNRFDDFGKMALLGRAYMFMDAQAPNVVRIERATA